MNQLRNEKDLFNWIEINSIELLVGEEGRVLGLNSLFLLPLQALGVEFDTHESNQGERFLNFDMQVVEKHKKWSMDGQGEHKR